MSVELPEIAVLARAAGHRDLSAARRLVRLLEREEGLTPGEDSLDGRAPPMFTASPEVRELVARVDALVLRALSPINGHDWLKGAGRCCPRPASPGARLIGGALHACWVSNSPARVGWAWEPHYRQLIALAVAHGEEITLGVGLNSSEFTSRPTSVWGKDLHAWTVCPRVPGFADNVDVPSRPLCDRLIAWAEKSEVDRISIPIELVYDLLEALAGGEPWSFWQPLVEHVAGDAYAVARVSMCAAGPERVPAAICPSLSSQTGARCSRELGHAGDHASRTYNSRRRLWNDAGARGAAP